MLVKNEYMGNDDEAERWTRVLGGLDVTIGWRHRVISIRVNSPKGIDGSTLCSGDDVTHGEGFCHAWGYDKAQEYIRNLAEMMGVESDEH